MSRFGLLALHVPNAAGGLLLATGGGYMIGTVANQYLPTGAQIYDYFHPEVNR